MRFWELGLTEVERATRKKWLLALGGLSAIAGAAALGTAIYHRDLLLRGSSSLLAMETSPAFPFFLKLLGALGLLFTAFMCFRRELYRKHWMWRMYLFLLPATGTLVAIWADNYLLDPPQAFLDRYIWLPVVNALLSSLSFPLLKKKGPMRWATLVALVTPVLFLIKVIYYLNVPAPETPAL